MKLFVVVSSLLAVATAAPQLLTQHLYAAVPTTTYVAAPVAVASQYHAQDALGQYTYGYNGGLSAKTEAKSFDGVTRGAYSYLDAENKLQTVTYTADAVNGFRAEASNMPVAPVETRMAPKPVEDTPEVAQAKVEHMAAVEEAKVRNAAAEMADEEDTSSVVVNAAPAAPVAAFAPITYAAAAPAAPVAAFAPITYAAAAPAAALAPASGFSYSTSSLAYNNEPVAYTTYAAPAPASFSYATYRQSAPTAVQYSAIHQPAFAYSYGVPAYYTTSHIAAAPVAISARSLPEPAAEVALPEPVQDTPEVAQAKAEHLQAVAEVKARNLQ
ncbi:angiomotin-like [Ochlerotatus camptorhynchus]|uniref:angiomotin-like n=1 Tax=Ochlerotatus camptorhynchus TaxID=644619 RepID=UPI0031D0A8F6